MSHHVPSTSNQSRIDETAPVLIVGGGVTGLSAALFLAWHGVRPLLVERHSDLLIHPRARGFTARTTELFRQVGLEPAIRAASFASGEAFQWVAIHADSLAGEWHAIEEPDESAAFGELSPAPFAPIDQDKLETILRARAEELGADMRFSTEMVSCAQDESGVTAVLRDRQRGDEWTVRADYLVAADGWESPIRQQLGVSLAGPGPFFNVLTVLADVDLRPVLHDRRVNIAYLQQPRPGTILLAHDDAGQHWVFGTGFMPQYGESLADFSEQQCIELVRVAAGLPDAAVTLRSQIPGTDLKVLGFAIGAQVAQQYRVGRIFLVGDAAHIVPPTGGLGANTGIQDAHNLAWKLAAVVQGEAGSVLLDTYHDERYPVGLLTMDQALARWGSRVGEGTVGEAPSLLEYGSIAFGYRYRSAAVAGESADSRPVLPVAELHGQPGTHAPHVWLRRNGQQISTIDLFGRRYALLTGPDGGAWIDAARAMPGAPVDTFCIGEGGDLEDPDRQWATAYGVTASGAMLVRPDGFVAWRARQAEDDPACALVELTALLESHAIPAS